MIFLVHCFIKLNEILITKFIYTYPNDFRVPDWLKDLTSSWINLRLIKLGRHVHKNANKRGTSRCVE